MSVTEIRVFPVNATIVMRSTLFALANMGAKLQAYNETSGIIVATVSKWLGIQKQEVVARVRGHETSCQLELEAPDIDKANELLQLIGTYVRDGARIQANATIQWVDLARQQANKARRQQMTTQVKQMLSSNQPATTADTEIIESATDQTALVPADDPARPLPDNFAEPIPIPDNPGVLVKNHQNRIIELKVDPEVFTDRTGYLVACSVCKATAIRGSLFCPNCGRPLTLEAIQPEMRQGIQRSANSALTYGLIGLALNLVPLLILVLPALLSSSTGSVLERISESLTPLTIALSLALGVLPAVFLGWWAIRHGQRAAWYNNLSAVLEQGGRGKSAVGNAIGWLDIYLGAAWIIFIVIALL
jgi:hypothetical protein